MIIHSINDRAFKFERRKDIREGESNLRLCHTAKQDESEPDILVDELHPCVCPNCGISKFEDGHEKDIVYDDFDCDFILTRCWGGFGEMRYKYLPHKCKACGTVFAPWVVEKRVNGDVIGFFIGLIFSVAIAITTTVASAAIDELILLLGTVVALMFMAGCIAGIEGSTYCVCDPEKQISDKLKYAEIIGKYLEDDDDDETEGDDVAFGVNTQQAASACKDLATANMSEPKSAMEVFDTLTPEQKAVAYYLIGDHGQQILAMQHIQDQVQANTAKRMNDILEVACMNVEYAMKILEDEHKKDIERNDTSKWTDKELCSKIIFVLDKRLSVYQKECSYGDDYAGIAFEFAKALLETFDKDPKVNTDMILGYSVNIFIYEICNFCGCGCNAKLLRYILKFLECFNYDGEGRMLDKKLFNKVFSHPLMPDNDMWVSYEFLAKWVDSIGLSDHGTSVCSSWLTDEGLIWREVLRRACKEEESDAC